MTPVFTIIIPIYNVAIWLRDCLDSVLAQVCCDWECICVDDGSTDGGGSVLDRYVEECKNRAAGRFKVIHQRNCGVALARNVALDNARGDWVVFLDADDCIQSNVLSRALRAIEKHRDVDLLSIGLEYFNSDLPVVDDCLKDDIVVDISRHILYEVDEKGFTQFIYRRSLIGGLRFPPYVMGEDRLFKTWILLRASKIVHLNGVEYFYRIRSGSAINGKRNWRKWYDDLRHSVRRLWALFLSRKNIEWRIYRHQYGLMLRLLQGIVHIEF